MGCAKVSSGGPTLIACNYSPGGNVIYNGGDSYYSNNVTKPNPCDSGLSSVCQ